jgi:hypothetical protein
MKKLTTKKTKNRAELLLATLIALFFVIYSFMFLIEATNATVPLLVKLIKQFPREHHQQTLILIMVG